MSDFIQLEYLQEKLQQLLAESLFAIYLYGSAVDGGLGPESDLDVLVVVTQPLTSALREQLAQELLKISQPVGELQRPLEVTILFSVHDKFHRTLILSGFCLLKIAKISLNSSFFPKPIKR